VSATLPVVANAGPLMVLAKLNVLHLLKQLYGRVHISRSVYDEVVVEGMRHGHPDASTLHLFLSQMEWQPEDVEPTGIPADIQAAHLDRGERDTLGLALALGKCLVLIDDTAGRQAARAHGMSVKGSLGILIEAYRREMVTTDQLRLYFAEIVRRHDIWINRALAERLLHETLGTQR